MARQRKVTQQTVADGSRLTGCVTRTHGRHHYVTTEDGNIMKLIVAAKSQTWW